MAFELGVFCRQERNAPDLRTLQCSTDLEKAFNNHRIPNPLHGESLTPNSLTPLQRVGIPPYPTYFLQPALLMTAALILAFVGVLMRIGCFIARVLGRTPNLRFEFLATWPAAIWLRGPKSPFVRPETGLGEGVTFAARRGREVAHLGPNVRVFQRPLDILWTEKSKLASMLVVWSPRGPGYMTWGECVGAAGYPMGCQIGRLTRHETPLRLARPSQATKISKPNRFAYPSRSRPRGVYRPLWLIWHRPRHLVIEIRQIWGWCPPPSLHKSLHPSLYL